MVDEPVLAIVPDDPAGEAAPMTRRPRPYPGLGAALLLLLAVHLLANAVAAVALLAGLLLGGTSLDSWTARAPVLGIIANTLAFGAVTWFAWRRSGAPAGRVFPFGGVSPLHWPPMLLALAGALLVVNDLSNLLLRVLPAPDFVRELFAEFLGRGKGVVSLVFLVVVAPVTEEMFFRGALLSSFRARYGVGGAVVWSAVLFGVVHVLPWQIVPAFSLGLLFAWWTIRSGSLWPALAAHALTNGVAFFQGLSQAPEDIFVPSPQPIALTLGGAVLLAGGIAWSAALFRRRGPTAAERFERSLP